MARCTIEESEAVRRMTRHRRTRRGQRIGTEERAARWRRRASARKRAHSTATSRTSRPDRVHIYTDEANPHFTVGRARRSGHQHRGPLAISEGARRKGRAHPDTIEGFCSLVKARHRRTDPRRLAPQLQSYLNEYVLRVQPP